MEREREETALYTAAYDLTHREGYLILPMDKSIGHRLPHTVQEWSSTNLLRFPEEIATNVAMAYCDDRKHHQQKTRTRYLRYVGACSLAAVASDALPLVPSLLLRTSSLPSDRIH